MLDLKKFESHRVFGSPGVGFTAPLYVWDKFIYYQVFRNQSPVFLVGKKRVSAVEKYSNPLKMALKYREMLDQGQADSQADLSRILGVSRAKVTQILNLLRLDDEIKGFMMDLKEADTRLQLLTERKLRSLVQMPGGAQRMAFLKIVDFGTESRNNKS